MPEVVPETQGPRGTRKKEPQRKHGNCSSEIANWRRFQ